MSSESFPPKTPNNWSPLFHNIQEQRQQMEIEYYVDT